MRGSDGSTEETFVSVRQASDKGKESTGKKEILNCGSLEIGAQEQREKILWHEAQSCLAKQIFDREGRQAHRSAFENDGKKVSPEAPAGTQARSRTSRSTREASGAQTASGDAERLGDDGRR
jgi:hypothetical protein